MKLHIVVVAFVLSWPTAVFADFMPERLKLFMAAKYVELEQLGERELKEDPSAPSSKLMPLCAAYSKLKRYNKLFPCLERLEENIQRGDTAAMDLEEMRKGNPMMFGLAMMGSAAVGGPDGLKGTVVPWLHMMRTEAYNELRNYDLAIASAQRAFETIPTRWNEERMFRIQALTALGLSHAFAGKREEAAKYAEELTAVSTFYPYSGLTTDKVMGVAKIWLALGDYQKAYDGLRSDSVGLGGLFLGLGDIIGGGMVGMGGESLFTWQELPKQFMVVKTQLEVGQTAEAKAGYDKLLENPRTANNGEIYWVLLHDRGRIAAGEGDLPAAIGYWQKAVEIIEQQRSTINTEASKIGFVGDKQDVYKKLIDALIQTQRLPDAFDYLERSKSRALIDMLASKKDFAAPEGDSKKIHELLAKVEQTEMEARGQGGGAVAPAAAEATSEQPSQPAESSTEPPSQSAESAAASSSSPAPAASGQRSLMVSSVKLALAEIPPEVASLVSVSSTPIEEIQARIPEDEVLVEYYYDDKSLSIFLLSRDGLQAVRADVGNLLEGVKSLRIAIADPKSDAYLPVAQQLYRQLVQPIVPLLAGRSKLIIVPQGVLHYVPFAALHDGSQFMLNQYAFRLLPSASVVKYLRDKQTRKPGGILAFGNPDLGDPKYDLKFAEEEAKAIIQTVAKSRVVLRKEATEAALRRNASGYNYLHFATHGEFNADKPLNSALLLAKDASSDGVLSVSKLYSMRLDVDLATLSACETGLGEIANGDDVVGLTRGFLFAGASSIVASLWPVDDQATSELMSRFYLGLNGKDKREALRQAQISARGKYAHPYYWAAFQLTGNAN